MTIAEMLLVIFFIILFDGGLLWYVYNRSRDVERLRDEWRQYRKMRLIEEEN